MKNVMVLLFIDDFYDEDYEESQGSHCYPYVGEMQATNLIAAKIECSSTASCEMFYQLGTDETR